MEKERMLIYSLLIKSWTWEKISYQYEMEEGDVDVSYFEDLKDCSTETNQHGIMEEKASFEVEVTYVFQTDNMCLVAGFIVGTQGQLPNIVQKFEEDEDEDKIMDMWNVYVLNVYWLILLQVLCKWIVGILNEEAKLSDGNQISFHWLKENIEEEIVLRDNMAVQDRAEDIEGSGNESVVLQQWEKPLEVLNTYEQECVATEDNKNDYILMTMEDIQTRVFQQRDKLDDEIYELWKPMQKSSKWRYDRKRKTVSLEEQLIVQICISKTYGGLQIKIRDLGGLRIKFK